MTTQPRRYDSFPEVQLSKFDLLLGVIPLILVCGILIAPLLPIPQFVVIALSAALAASLVGYSIYAVMRVEPVIR